MQSRKQMMMGQGVMKMPQADCLHVFMPEPGLRQELRAAIALQGLVNRQGAEVYLITPGFEADDRKWLEELRPYYASVTEHHPEAGNSVFLTMFALYRRFVDRLIVYDPLSSYQWNIAITMAGVEGGLPVTPMVLQKIQETVGFGGEIVRLDGKFTGKAEAYDWALENLLPGCASFGVLSQDPAGDHRFHDYGVAAGLFCFWLDLTVEEDAAIQKKIFSSGHFRENPILFGYAPQNDDLLIEGSPCGFGFIVSDWFGNGTVHASIPGITLPMQRPGRAVEVENDKIYVSIFWSDGDNIQFDQLGTRRMWDSARSAGRGELPLGTTVASLLTEMAPVILQWYVRHMTEHDELIAGPSGWQFIYVNQYNPAKLDDWIAKNRYWLKRAGIRVANPWRFSPVNDRGLVEKYMAGTQVDGALTEAIEWDSSNAYIRSGKPVLLARGNLDCSNHRLLNDDFLKPTYDKMKKTGKPQFISVNTIVAWAKGDFANLTASVENLEPAIREAAVFLTPSDLVATFQKYAADNGITDYV